MTHKPRVLIICTGNSMRSQLAEGVLRADLGEQIDVFSAGTHPSYVHPLTMAALAEAGIDPARHYSKNLSEFLGQDFDLVITVCDSAHQICPVFPGARKTIHCGYPDPIGMTPTADAAQVFAQLRDRMRVELRERVVKELGLRWSGSAADR